MEFLNIEKNNVSAPTFNPVYTIEFVMRVKKAKKMGDLNVFGP